MPGKKERTILGAKKAAPDQSPGKPENPSGSASWKVPEGPFFPEDPREPWSLSLLEELLVFLKKSGGSDLVMSSGSRASMRIDGVWRRTGTRAFTAYEMAESLNSTTGDPGAASLVLSGVDHDYAFEVGRLRSERLRFRANAVAVRNAGGNGLSLSFRLIPREPAPLESLELEPELLDNLFPENGLVLVTGVMGSGKSSLMASVMREIVLRGGRHVCTYESPVEFDLSGMGGPESPVEQTEVPRQIADFPRAVRNLTRRAADVVLVGESRDPETLRGLLEAAELGLAVYSTAHTRSVSSTPTRILNVFPPEEKKGIAASLFSSIRVLIQQRLLPRRGGGRKAVREYLVLDDSLRGALARAPEGRLPLVLERMVREKGSPLIKSVQRELEAGEIEAESLRKIVKEKGAE
ncbi:MAG: Flp pilus assembly complex ATPase component TadA [Deltaproteobacteria bacterium]|nr:Flp pilus assembly complex ATPase component TadA [Deltaproteobacteria bacterium]